MTEQIAFIGGGQMAGSLIGGLLAAGWAPEMLRVAEPDGARADTLRLQFGITVHAAAAPATDGAQAVVLAVKPQVLQGVARKLELASGCTAISIAAGVNIASLRDWLGKAPAIIRCMPNTPALLGHGVTALFAPPGTPDAARALATRILESVGQTCWLADESQLDVVTAVSGSGPAYFFLLTEALREAGQSLGLDADTASLLARQTFSGAGRMAESGVDVAQLREQVTSKGGTTEAALATLESQGFRARIRDAVEAATRRGRELGTELAKRQDH